VRKPIVGVWGEKGEKIRSLRGRGKRGGGERIPPTEQWEGGNASTNASTVGKP